MAAGIDPVEAEIILKARSLQNRVLDTISKDESLYDPRDIRRVQRDLWFCSKYIRHTGGNMVTAYERMIACLLWRKKDGINDITIESLDRSIVESGLAYDRGQTRSGSRIFIVNNRLHKRDSARSAELKKLMIFILNTHFWIKKDQKLVLFFDMTDTGLANADLEMVKVVITLFRDYFPDTLDYLLVYDLPWVLHAAWAVVKTMLSEAATKRVKFASKADVQELIAPDQLLARYGGEDTWEFVFTQELFEQYRREYSISDKDHPMPTGDFLDPSELGDEEGNAASIPLQRKQVRFDDSSNLARSPRQRFSGDTNTVIRRRQVEKILAMQGAGPQRSLSSGPTLTSADFEGEEEEEEMEGSGVHALLKMSPSREVVFSKLTDNGDRSPRAVLTFTNQHSETITYKIKTTAPSRYRVKPNISKIDPGQSMNIHIHLLLDPQEHLGPVSQDKFLIQVCPVDQDASELLAFWRNVSKENVLETMLYCRLVDESSKASAIKAPPTESPPPPVPMATSAPTKQPSVSVSLKPEPSPLPSNDLKLLELQLSSLVEVGQKLERRMARTQHLVAAILFAMVAFLVYTVLFKQ